MHSVKQGTYYVTFFIRLIELTQEFGVQVICIVFGVVLDHRCWLVVLGVKVFLCFIQSNCLLNKEHWYPNMVSTHVSHMFLYIWIHAYPIVMKHYLAYVIEHVTLCIWECLSHCTSLHLYCITLFCIYCNQLYSAEK